MSDADDDPDRRTRTALADVARLTGAACRRCGAALCGHEGVFSLVLGYKAAPRCLGCTAAHMGEAVASLRERTLTYVRHHACFTAAWRRASELEGSADDERPACVFAKSADVLPDPERTTASPAPATSVTWNAGPMSCGDLVLELRQRLMALPAGSVLELRAEDPGAPIDLPAWCTLTGHTMLEARHPTYRIRRKA
ncbi:MAG: sulfurtransferase TusA family protein [Planctomycetota bacterium]